MSRSRVFFLVGNKKTNTDVYPVVATLFVDSVNAHFKAIGHGDVEQIMQDYADAAVFQWVGGSLNGAYTSNDKIKGVWSKFAKGNAPLEVTTNKIEESSNPAGSTVTVNV
ncbi:MAG: hypothetical protein ACOH1I_00375 [Gallionellaceae bacterium]|jgi:hypothetical protein